MPSIEKNIGILIMFAVRRALSSPERLKGAVQQLIETGEIDPNDIDVNNPLGDMIASGVGESIPDIAYRFCREEPGTHVILSGTGNPAHLRVNRESFDHPILSSDAIAQLKSIFRNVTSITGE